jgi:hypothetical protein
MLTQPVDGFVGKGGIYGRIATVEDLLASERLPWMSLIRRIFIGGQNAGMSRHEDLNLEKSIVTAKERFRQGFFSIKPIL